MNFPYQVDFSGSFSQKIGDFGLSEAHFNHSLKKAYDAAKKMSSLLKAEGLPLFSLPKKRDDLGICARAADILTENRLEVMIFGTGGSSLGAQVLCQKNGWRVPGLQTKTTKGLALDLHFFDNLDPFTFKHLQKTARDWSKVGFLIVSKSGGTPETLAQLLVLLPFLKKKGIKPSEHLVIITEQDENFEKNPLGQIAKQEGVLILPHVQGLGGRYSVLSNVGILPALCVGGDPIALRQGAEAVLSPLYEIEREEEMALVPWVQGACLVDGFSTHHGLKAVIMMPYSDQLRAFSSWFCQLWAESLGKNGQGTQPIAACGPVDQHSQMQLFLDGPRDKLLTLISIETDHLGPSFPENLSHLPSLHYFEKHTIGDLVSAQVRALQQTFLDQKRPLRAFSLKNVDDYTLGGLLMHFMLETILLGFMIGVDPFDQPAVEQAKVLTRSYLAS